MSQFTFATLVKGNQEPIAHFLEKSQSSSYLFPANPDWQAVIVENDMEIAEQTAQKMSLALDTSALYFFDCVDHGWGYSLFHRGRLESECFVNYEESSIHIHNHGEAALYKACVNPEAYMIFRRWVKHFYDHLDEIFGGVELFKKAFAIEKIEWISYAYLSTDSDERLNDLEAQFFPGSKKIIPVKKIIFEILQDSFNQIGYFLDESMSDRKRFAFTRKDEHGYTYGIYLDASDNGKISASLYSPTVRYLDMFWVVRRQYRSDMPYEDEDQLRLVLEEIRDVFVDLGHKWLHDNQIERFDVNAVYQKIITPYLEEKGFRMEHEDNPIMFGGKLIYKRERGSATFEHFAGTTGVKIIMNEGDDELTLNELVHRNRNNPQFYRDGMRFTYTDHDTFLEFLDGVTYYLDRYFEKFSSK